MPLPFVTTGIVRLSRTRLFHENPDDNRRQRYTAAILLPKSDVATWCDIKNAIADAMILGLNKKWRDLYAENIVMPIKDGDGVTIKGAAFGSECAGNMVIMTSSFIMPDMVDIYMRPISNQHEIYAGVYAHTLLQFYPYINDGVPGISCILRAIMKVADGERIEWNRSLAQYAFSNVVADMKKSGSVKPSFQKEVNNANVLQPARAQPDIEFQRERSDDIVPWEDERYKDILNTMRNRVISLDELKKLAEPTELRMPE